MALLEATSILTDFDMFQNIPLSPVSSAFSSDNSTVPWNSSSDESSSITPLTNVSMDYFQPTEEPLTTIDFSFLSSNENIFDERQTSEPEFVKPVSREEIILAENSNAEDILSTKIKQDKGEIRKTRKKKASQTPSESCQLPPCRICADAASGFHYGVNSCEACKRFFRRALERKRHFKCKGNKNCVIKGKKNNVCGYCRFSRCLAVGMSKTAIKTGRYTQEKRAQDIQEVQRRTANQSTLSMTDAEVDVIVQTLVSVHVNVITNAHVPRDVMEDGIRQKLEEFQLKMEVFGFQNTLTAEQYDEVFQYTGLDVDGRKTHMKVVAKCIDKFVQGYIQFSKGVPGFQSLSQKDQANLLKIGRAEIWLLGAYRGFRKDSDMFYAPNNDIVHKLEMERLLGKAYCDYAFDLSSRLQKLSLTFEEEVVLKTVCLTFADRCDLDDGDNVERIQWRMIRCLLHLLRKNHPQDSALFYKVVNWIVAMRNFSDLSQKALSNTHFTDAIRTNATLVDMILI